MTNDNMTNDNELRERCDEFIKFKDGCYIKPSCIQSICQTSHGVMIGIRDSNIELLGANPELTHKMIVDHEMKIQKRYESQAIINNNNNNDDDDETKTEKRTRMKIASRNRLMADIANYFIEVAKIDDSELDDDDDDDVDDDDVDIDEDTKSRS